MTRSRVRRALLNLINKATKSGDAGLRQYYGAALRSI
jgi:hypothetical protein